MWKKFASTETGAPPALTLNWTDLPPPSGDPIGFFDAAYPLVGGAGHRLDGRPRRPPDGAVAKELA